LAELAGRINAPFPEFHKFRRLETGLSECIQKALRRLFGLEEPERPSDKTSESKISEEI
jgi:hypothetical protein